MCNRKQIYIAIIIFSVIVGTAQNLVPNPSFETYTLCPNASSQIESSIPWTAATTNSSTDYFNSCSVGTSGVPYNADFNMHVQEMLMLDYFFYNNLIIILENTFKYN